MQIKSLTFMKRKFLRLYMAGIFSMLVTIILPLTDSVIGGQVIGEDALVAINIVIPAFNVASFLGGLVCFGIPVLYSNAMGAFDKDEANRLYSIGLISSLFIGLLYFLILVFFGEYYIQSYGAEPGILELAHPYFFWYKLNILITPFFLFLNELVMADGNEMLGTISCVTQFVVNLVGSIILSHPLGMSGIGMASFLGTACSTGVLMLHYLSKGCSLKFVRYFNFKKLLKIASFSIVDSLTYLYAAIFVSVVNYFVIANIGEQYLPIVSIYSFMFEFMILFNGIAAALNPMVAIYNSEENYKSIHTVMKFASRVSVVFGALMTILMFIAAPAVPHILGINSSELVQMSTFAIRCIALFFIFVSLHYEYSSYYNVQQKFVVAVIMCMLRDLIFPLALGLSLGSLFGLTGLSIGIAIAIVITDLLVMLGVHLLNRKMTIPRLFLDDDGHVDTYVYNFKTSEHEIMQAIEQAMAELKNHSVPQNIQFKVSLIMEEGFMLIREKNDNKDILAECTLMIGDQVELIFRDMGVIFNLIDEDACLNSYRQYIVASIMPIYSKKNYLLTNSYNRSRFIFPRE